MPIFVRVNAQGLPGTNRNIPLAVYGTLRKGCSNYHRYLRGSEHVGTFTTGKKYRLILADYPSVLPFNGQGHRVEVDLFLVDVSTLRRIDWLEGHPHMYRRSRVCLSNGVRAWMYLRDIPDTGRHLLRFSDESPG